MVPPSSPFTSALTLPRAPFAVAHRPVHTCSHTARPHTLRKRAMKAEPTLREPVPDRDCREAMRPCREGESATCDRQGCQGDNFTRRLTCCRRCELQTWQLQTISAVSHSCRTASASPSPSLPSCSTPSSTPYQSPSRVLRPVPPAAHLLDGGVVSTQQQVNGGLAERLQTLNGQVLL